VTRDDKTQSGAIHDALVESARRRNLEALAADAARVAADENDRREIVAVQALMESLREEG
jgi:hypothetical protein